MIEKGLYKDYTLQQVLDKLDVIECFESDGKKRDGGEKQEKQQK
jgi:hypothetical protein